MLAGWKGQLRYHPVDLLPVSKEYSPGVFWKVGVPYPTTPTGDVGFEYYDVWRRETLVADSVIDVDWNFAGASYDMTGKSAADRGYAQSSLGVLQFDASISFLWVDVDKDPDLSWNPIGDSTRAVLPFNRFVVERAMSRVPVGLAILERASYSLGLVNTTTRAVVGNFYLQLSKSEQIKGMQVGTVRLTPADYVGIKSF